MHFADLTDTPFNFQCEFIGHDYKYWQYDFTAQYHDNKFLRNLDKSEIQILRDNCKRILHATECFHGGNENGR